VSGVAKVNSLVSALILSTFFSATDAQSSLNWQFPAGTTAKDYIEFRYNTRVVRTKIRGTVIWDCLVYSFIDSGKPTGFSTLYAFSFEAEQSRDIPEDMGSTDETNAVVAPVSPALSSNRAGVCISCILISNDVRWSFRVGIILNTNPESIVLHGFR